MNPPTFTLRPAGGGAVLAELYADSPESAALLYFLHTVKTRAHPPRKPLALLVEGGGRAVAVRVGVCVEVLGSELKFAAAPAAAGVG